MEAADPKLVSFITVLITLAISQWFTWYWAHRKSATDTVEKEKTLQDVAQQRLIDRIVHLEIQQGSLQTTILPLSTAFQAILVKELTHFHTPEMDALLVKLGPPYNLTDEEEARLAELLVERANSLDGEIDESEKEAALILPYVMKRVKNDVRHLAKAELVIVPRTLLIPNYHEED
jgi:hypothetical protein